MTSQVAIYVRISSDRTGEGAGVQRQETLCREYATAKGWTVSAVLIDNDVSATTGVVRPGFEQLLAGLADGTFSGVVAYHADRLYRSLRDLGRLLDLHKTKPFVMGTITGDLDLGTDQGRMMAGILASVAAGEVERKTRRQTDSNRDRAIRGIPSTRVRAFGWEPDNLHLRKSEADAIRQAYADLISGKTSLTRLAKEWNALGLQTSSPKQAPWTAAKIRGIFERERNCGRSIYQGQVVGTGQWEAITNEQDHDLLQSIFQDRSVTRDNRRIHAISGLPICGKCGARLFVDVINGKEHYICKKNSHLGIRKEYLDDIVVNWVKWELSDLDSPTLRNLNIADTVAHIRATRESLQALSAEETELGGLDIPLNVLKARAGILGQKRQVLETQLADLMTGDRVVNLIAGLTQHVGPRSAKEGFAERELIEKRWHEMSAVDQHFVLEHTCEITVEPQAFDNKGPYFQRAQRRVTVRPL